MSGRAWLAPLVAGATAALLVVPALRAAPAGAPLLMGGPPPRTLPTDVLVPWPEDGTAPPDLGAFVWCDGALGCRAFNDDDRAILAWAREALVAPYLAGEAPVETPAPEPTEAPPPSPTPIPAAPSVTAAPPVVPAPTVVCASAEFKGGVLTCAPAA